MSIWVSLYCQKRIGKINPLALVEGIKDRLDFFSDLFAQEDPQEVLSRLRVEEIQGTDDSQLLHLHHLEDGPPIVIDQIANQNEVSGAVKEYLGERFQDRHGDKERFVREHLGKVIEFFHFCLKQRHVDGMGTALVYAAAAWLGHQGNETLSVPMSRVDETRRGRVVHPLSRIVRDSQEGVLFLRKDRYNTLWISMWLSGVPIVEIVRPSAHGVYRTADKQVEGDDERTC